MSNRDAFELHAPERCQNACSEDRTGRRPRCRVRVRRVRAIIFDSYSKHCHWFDRVSGVIIWSVVLKYDSCCSADQTLEYTHVVVTRSLPLEQNRIKTTMSPRPPWRIRLRQLLWFVQSNHRQRSELCHKGC